MAKKSKKAEINLGIAKYSWAKEIDKPDANIDIIKDKIDSLLYMIENNLDKGVIGDELRVFIKVIASQGHIAKMSDDYKARFKKIADYYNKEYDSFVGMAVG